MVQDHEANLSGETTESQPLKFDAASSSDSDRCASVSFNETVTVHKIPGIHPELPIYLEDVFNRSLEHLPDIWRVKLREVLTRKALAFAKDSKDLGQCDWAEHHIDTGDEKPVRQRVRRVPQSQVPELRKQIEKLAEQGTIQPSHSSWGSNVVLVRKKDGSLRLCIDYRELNQKTKNTDAYMLPRMDDTIDQLRGVKYYCTLDFLQGYHQVKMSEVSKPKTAFITPQMTPSHWEYNYMPFGVQGGPGTFQRLMDRLLHDLEYKIALAYLDDIIVFGTTIGETMIRLEIVLDRIIQAGLKLKPSKCSLFQTSTLFLGHVVSNRGVSCDPNKVVAVQKWKAPTTVKEVRSFIGTVGYYKRFIKGFADLCRPLHILTRKNQKFHWTTECESSFQTLRTCLISAPVMAYPQEKGLYVLDTDASATAIGAVLSQMQKDEYGDDQERVIAYSSRVLHERETRYCARRRELLAIVHFVKQFKPYLYGRPMLIRTDHASLRYIKTLKDPNDQFARWISRLEDHLYTIETRRGANHQNADGLSRIGCGGKRCICEGVERLEEIETRPDDYTDHGLPLYEPSQEQAKVNVIHFGLLWTVDEMEEAQLTDPDIGPLMKAKQLGEQLKFEDIKDQSHTTKTYWADFDRLKIKNKLLYRIWESNDGQLQYDQLVLPYKYYDTVMEYLHDAKTACHLGRRRTQHGIQRRFFWYKMREYVHRYIKCCEKCQRRKRPAQLGKAPLTQSNWISDGKNWDGPARTTYRNTKRK